MIYFVTFAISISLFGIGIRCKKLKLRRICLCLSVLILACLAGVRDYTVGTDIRLYGRYVFEIANSCSSIKEILFGKKMSIELGYAILAYITSRFVDTPHAFFFVVGLINYGLIAKAIYDYRDNISPTMAWTCFLFLYFPDTFNIMRQTLALAIFLFGVTYVRNKNYKMSIVILIVSILFHTSAVIGIFVYALYIYLRKKRDYSLKRTLEISFFTLVGIVMLPYMLPVLIKIGVLPAIYSRYLGNYGMGIAINSFIIRVIPLIIIVIYEKQFRKSEDFQFLLLMLIIDILVYNLTTVNNTFERVSLYFGYFRIYAYSKLVCRATISNQRNRIILGSALVVYCIVIFFYQIIIKGGNQIYPFTSNVLGF